MTANDVALAARVVVALVLVASGVGKLLAVRQSVATYREQFDGDAWIAVAVALLLPVYELVLAGLLLFVDATWPSWLALATFAVFTVVLVRRVVIDDRRPCNCFGAASRRARPVVRVVVPQHLVPRARAGRHRGDGHGGTVGAPRHARARARVRRGVRRPGGAHVTSGSSSGRVIVLVGTDAAALGEVAAGLEASGARAAVFVGDVTEPDGRATLEEFVAELFPPDQT